MNIFERSSKKGEKKEKPPEFCKHNQPANTCGECRMSLEEAQNEANLLRAEAYQGNDSDAKDSKNFSSSALGYEEAEKALVRKRNETMINTEGKRVSTGFLEMEKKLKQNPEAEPDTSNSFGTFKRQAEEDAKNLTEKEGRRRLYEELKKEFEPEQK